MFMLIIPLIFGSSHNLRTFSGLAVSFVMKYADNIVKVKHIKDHLIFLSLILKMKIKSSDSDLSLWIIYQISGVFHFSSYAFDCSRLCLPLQFPSFPCLLPWIHVRILSSTLLRESMALVMLFFSLLDYFIHDAVREGTVYVLFSSGLPHPPHTVLVCVCVRERERERKRVLDMLSITFLG